MPRFVINNNGDDPDQLRSNFRRLFDVALDLEHALKEIRANALHGRNYQTLAYAAEARNQDTAELRTFAIMVEELKTWAADGHVRAQNAD